MAEIWYLVTNFIRYLISWEAFLDPSDSYFANAHLWYPRSSANRKKESDGSKTLLTIWGTYMMLVTKYQISTNILFLYPPFPEGGGGYTVLPLSVCPSVRPSVRPRYFSSHFDCLDYIIIKNKQDELWANAHLWYPRSSANRKKESDGSKTLLTIWGS
jgi:hypothetical protein